MRLMVALLWVAAASAQVTIEGQAVQKNTGEPLAGVRVVAACGQMLRTATDASGQFQFTGLPAVPVCWLFLDGPGLLPRAQLVKLHQDTHLVLRVVMTRQAVIAGKVIDENGWPVTRPMVTVAQYVMVDGVRELKRAAMPVQANERGEYRVGKLPPGRYYVRVRPRQDALWTDYRPAWYPAAAEVKDARVIEVREGQLAEATDVQLARGGGVELKGQVIPPAGFKPDQCFVTLASEELQLNSAVSVRIAADGSFKLRHVSPGSFLLKATTNITWNDSEPLPFSAIQAIQVGTDNIEGIVLNVQPTVVRDIKGMVTVDGAMKPEHVRIELQRRNSNTVLTAKVAADGSFMIPGVWPGEYTGNVQAVNGQPISMRLGGREILFRTFLFDGAEAPLQVTVKDPAGFVAVQGEVRAANERPIAGAAIVLRPVGSMALSASRIQLDGHTDQNGVFVTRQVPPGDFRIYVIEEPEEAEQLMSDPDFLKAQEKAFAPLTIRPGKNEPLKLVLPE